MSKSPRLQAEEEFLYNICCTCAGRIHAWNARSSITDESCTYSDIYKHIRANCKRSEVLTVINRCVKKPWKRFLRQLKHETCIFLIILLISNIIYNIVINNFINNMINNAFVKKIVQLIIPANSNNNNNFVRYCVKFYLDYAK